MNRDKNTYASGVLSANVKKPVLRLTVKLLLFCLILGQHALVADDHDHDHPPGAKPKPAGSAPPGPSREDPGERPSGPRPGAPSAGGEDGCSVSPQTLADFANGESYNFKGMVTYLTAPQCALVSKQLGQIAAKTGGVSFSTGGPFKLDGIAKAWLNSDFESGKRGDMALARSVPNILRQNPLNPNELLPILGQLAILSPSAARSTLANLIQQELYAGDQMLLQAGRRGSEAAASDIARTLLRLGANESIIASEMAGNVEDLALMAQADSLGKIFRALAAAATVEASLVPTFNLTAGAFNRGIQRGKELYLATDKSGLQSTVFVAIRAALASNDALESGATELNEAMSALTAGQPLQATALKKLWKEAVRVLSASTNQTALAEAVALSLNPQMIFLLPEDMQRLLVAAKNYPEIAASVQTNFLLAWARTWDDLHDQKIQMKVFNQIKTKYFEPLVARILDLDPYLIDSVWLKEVLKRGLIHDEDIEKRFPRFVLAYLERRDKATKIATVESGLEPTMSSLAENFAVLWTLSNVHVPALTRWVRKYEQ